MIADTGFERIKASLYKLIDAQKALLESSKGMQKFIVAGDAESVNKQVKLQHELLSGLIKAENERMRAVSEWGTAHGLGEDELTMSNIAKKAGGQDAEDIKKISGELAEIISEQKILNEQNQSLLDLHFEYMNFLVDNFLEEPQLNSIYGSTGVLESGSSVIRIDGEV